MAHYAEELEMLKEFLTLKIEQLQMKVSELQNQKEDLEAMHSSSSEIKEHLLHQLNEMTRNFTEVNSELLIKSSRVVELEQFETVEKEKREEEQKQLKLFKKDVSKEVKALRKETVQLKEQNNKLIKSLLSVRHFM